MVNVFNVHFYHLKLLCISKYDIHLTHIYFLILGNPTGISPKIDFSVADAVKSDVQYRLIRSSTENGTLLNETTVCSFPLNKSLPTKLLIHGFTTNESSIWYKPLKNAYLSKGPHNIFYIDWSKAGNKTYEISGANTKPIGAFVGDFLIASGICLDKIHVIGHSMGSHLAGFIGKHIFNQTGEKIYRITATDPAKPFYETPTTTEDDRVSDKDATFVDIIHTDIRHWGFASPIGHVDFYANDGIMQPGCPSLQEDGKLVTYKVLNILIFNFQKTAVTPNQTST